MNHRQLLITLSALMLTSCGGRHNWSTETVRVPIDNVHMVPASTTLPAGYCIDKQLKPEPMAGTMHMCPSEYCEVTCAQ